MGLIRAAIAVDRALERGANGNSAAKAAGCKHAATRFGTAQQCGDCPAAQMAGPDPAAGALAAEIGGPGRIVPGECGDEAEHIPGDMRHVLDETAEFVGRYVSCTRGQADAMVLYAAATNALKASPAFGEMLFAAKAEQSGKTTAMTVTASLCANC